MMAEFEQRRITRELQGGRIINLSTDAASGFGQNASYGASKFAMESYSRAAAHELGPIELSSTSSLQVLRRQAGLLLKWNRLWQRRRR